MIDEDVNLILAEKADLITLSGSNFWKTDELEDFVTKLVETCIDDFLQESFCVFNNEDNSTIKHSNLVV